VETRPAASVKTEQLFALTATGNSKQAVKKYYYLFDIQAMIDYCIYTNLTKGESK
tara:strand:- start:478 stop:642 length:165 start_codon:yes stop_codon:yes gene_type:complete